MKTKRLPVAVVAGLLWLALSAVIAVAAVPARAADVKAAAVEVKIDNGPWMNAKLDAADKSAFAWRFWHLDWSPAPGCSWPVS